VNNGYLNKPRHLQVPKFMHRQRSFDRLGNLIYNHHIKQALYDEVVALATDPLTTAAPVTDVDPAAPQASATLMNGEQMDGELVMAANSRLAGMMARLGNGAHMQAFGRRERVCRGAHPLLIHGSAQGWSW
ncbi:ubiquinone biosynthesis protein UbiH, partial [Moraxella catarrhalis]|nr:ubiquinone biosynthesis protein UbiH [Moraxella catarrhalis]